jgi:hypothetical protein
MAKKCTLKGTVQRKLNGPKVVPIDRSHFSVWPWGIFLKFKGTSFITLQKNGYSGLRQKMWLTHFYGTPSANSW